MKRICCFLLVAVIIFTVIGSLADSFTVSYTTYDTTYEKILKMYLRVINAYGSNNIGRHDLFNDAIYGGDPGTGSKAVINSTKKNIGYMIYDVNQDGIDELLIGSGGGNINSVFTMDNGRVRELIRAGGYGTASSNYTCSMLVDGTFFRWGHGGAGLDYYEIWQMNGTGAVSFAGGYHTEYVWDNATQTGETVWYRSNAPMSRVTSPASARVNSSAAEKWLRTQEENVYTKRFVPFSVLEKFPNDPWNIAMLSVNGSASSTAKVNVRKEANETSKLVAAKNVGTYVRVLSEEEGYFKIAFGKLEGYIRREYLTPLTYKIQQETPAGTEDDEAPATQDSEDRGEQDRYPRNGKTNNNSVNVRAETNKKSKLVVTIKKKGSEVTVKGEAADADGVLWYEVEYKGKEGFVRNDFIDLEEPVTANVDPNQELYGLVIKKLATRSGPSPRAEDTGTYSLKGKRIRVYSRAYDPIENAWWVKCDVPYLGEIRTLWAWYTRFDSKTLPLESIPIEEDVQYNYSYSANNTEVGGYTGSSSSQNSSSDSVGQDDAPSGKDGLYGKANRKLETRSGPSSTYEDTGVYPVEGQYIKILCRQYDLENDTWWVKCEIPYQGEIRTLWAWYGQFDDSVLPLEKIPVEDSEYKQAVTKGDVYVRISPSADSEVIRILSANETVTIFDSLMGDDGNEWVVVDLNGYESGYVMKSDVAFK